MNEQWTRWEPIKELATVYDNATITYSEDEVFIITLGNDAETIQVTFPHGIRTHMATPHSCKIKAHIREIDYPQDMWSFYQATHSPYLEWLSNESYNIIDLFPLFHFVFVTGTTHFDIIASYEPTVTRVT